MDEIIRVDSYDFDDRAGFGIVIALFYEYQDPSGRMMMSVMEELAEEYEDQITVLAVDMEQSPDLAMRFETEISPTVIIFRNGEEQERTEGMNSPNVYSDIISELI